MIATEIESVKRIFEDRHALELSIFHPPVCRFISRDEAATLAESLRLKPDQMELANDENRHYDEAGYLLKLVEDISHPTWRSYQRRTFVDYGEIGGQRLVTSHLVTHQINMVGEEGTNWEDTMTLDPKL